MKKQVSSNCTQLTLNFEYAERPSIGLEGAASAEKGFHLTQEDFEESQAIEHDIMYGRGAYLYKQIKRDLAFQREQAKILKQFESMRASIYQ